MIRLRPYKSSDAKHILSWMQDERAFSMWSADKFQYPLTESQLYKYKEKYEHDEHAWLMTALDEKGTPIGHFLLRKADYKDNSIHIGFIIVDSNRRGKGYGQKMVQLAVKYAFEILSMKKVTLGVFDSNPAAHNCYVNAGFKDVRFEADAFTWEKESWGLYDMAAE